MKDAPIPVYSSPRLMGLELEYDCGSAEFRSPDPLPTGWTAKGDASLRNGREFILEPAVPFNNLMGHVQAFTEAFDPIRIGLTSRGGYHVHVQINDYTLHQALALVKVYSHFQTVINALLAKSRSENHFCRPFPASISERSISDEFHLREPADSRYEAKGSRAFRVINLAMMRCENPDHRSAEFRQGSPSKRLANIYGWATFVTALTEMSRDALIVDRALEGPNTLDGLLELLKSWETQQGCQHLADWVAWRHEIMNQLPTPELMARLVDYLRGYSRGLFSIATHLDINYPTALRLLEKAMTDGLVHRIDQRYRTVQSAEDIENLAVARLAQLQEAAALREQSSRIVA